MGLRARILIFLAVLMADAALVHQQPWPMAVGVVAYLALVFPALKR